MFFHLVLIMPLYALIIDTTFSHFSTLSTFSLRSLFLYISPSIIGPISYFFTSSLLFLVFLTLSFPHFRIPNQNKTKLLHDSCLYIERVAKALKWKSDRSQIILFLIKACCINKSISLKKAVKFVKAFSGFPLTSAKIYRSQNEDFPVAASNKCLHNLT